MLNEKIHLRILGTIARQRGVQNKKYNGKEFIEAHGLDEYDSQARMYYPAIMRTTTPVLLSVSIKVTEVRRSLQTIGVNLKFITY